MENPSMGTALKAKMTRTAKRAYIRVVGLIFFYYV
jgi:hypothetical protein